jgi:hypothetical protein
VSCLAVRDLFPEYALGTLLGDQRARVEQHLATCAACRKETSELQGAASSLAFGLPQMEPVDELEPRILRAVASAAARPPRRARTAVAAVLAAALAVAGLGWGAIMAGRAERSDAEAREAEQLMREAVLRFESVLVGTNYSPGTAADARRGWLVPTQEREGSGVAIVLVSREFDDVAFAFVTGLPRRAAPYSVMLVAADGERLQVGTIGERGLDQAGSAEIAREFGSEDLGRFSRVIVSNTRGRVVLEADVGKHSKATA